MQNSRSSALQALRLQDPVSEKEIQRAYRKMCLRYPAHSFAQKFHQIRTAYEYLTTPVSYWRDFITAREVDIGWMADFAQNDFTNIQGGIHDSVVRLKLADSNNDYEHADLMDMVQEFFEEDEDGI